MRQHIARIDHSPVTAKARDLTPFNGYHGQLFYAAACIRTARNASPVTRKAMLLQAEAHLCNALGCCNVQSRAGDLGAKASIGNIMTALNHTRRMIARAS